MVQRLSAILPLFPIPFFLVEFLKMTQSTVFDVCNSSNIIMLLISSWAEKSFLIAIYLSIASSILLVHVTEGIENVIQDYVHRAETKALCNPLIKCLEIECFKYVYVFIFL